MNSVHLTLFSVFLLFFVFVFFFFSFLFFWGGDRFKSLNIERYGGKLQCPQEHRTEGCRVMEDYFCHNLHLILNNLLNKRMEILQKYYFFN